MRILYAIQGTGNGHLSRARAIIPHLQQKADVDILVSGIQSDIPLPYEVKYKLRGMSFIFGKSGGVDYFNTYKKTQLKQFWKEVLSLPVEKYDLVINDFEPVSAWACKKKNVTCVGLSNQLAVLSPDAPKAKHEDPIGKAVLNYYAPVDIAYGLHFKQYNDRIYTPLIRKEVRDLKVQDKGHYTVYLPAHSDERILKVLRQIKDVKWEVFSKHNKVPMEYSNVNIRPINGQQFLKSMANSSGILCAAGFGTPSEALFLGKKLMVVPMKKQFEQQCNAAALKDLGVPVLKSFKPKHIDKIKDWTENCIAIKMDYPEIAGEIVDRILTEHNYALDNYLQYLTRGQFHIELS